MAYRHKTYQFTNSTEHSFYFCGSYGRKGEKRAKRHKATPEEIKRQNRTNKVNQIRRLIKANFFPNDYWICLMYPKGTRKSIEEVRKDFGKFRRRMSSDYRKRGEAFKFIYRIEIGRRGGIHIHIIMNRIWGTDLLVAKNWPHNANFQLLYERGDFRQLASYIAKPLPDEMSGQLSMFDDAEAKKLVSVNTSRNLTRPEPEVKEYKRRTTEKLVKDGPKPCPGYYIDKDSIKTGINPYTGYTYLHYTEVRINQIMRKVRGGAGWRTSISTSRQT